MRIRKGIGTGKLEGFTHGAKSDRLTWHVKDHPRSSLQRDEALHGD